MGAVTKTEKDGARREGKRMWLDFNGRLVMCVPEQLRPASPGEEADEWDLRRTPWAFQEATGLLNQGTVGELVDKGVPAEEEFRRERAGSTHCDGERTGRQVDVEEGMAYLTQGKGMHAPGVKLRTGVPC